MSDKEIIIASTGITISAMPGTVGERVLELIRAPRLTGLVNSPRIIGDWREEADNNGSDGEPVSVRVATGTVTRRVGETRETRETIPITLVVGTRKGIFLNEVTAGRPHFRARVEKGEVLVVDLSADLVAKNLRDAANRLALGAITTEVPKAHGRRRHAACY